MSPVCGAAAAWAGLGSLTVPHISNGDAERAVISPVLILIYNTIVRFFQRCNTKHTDSTDIEASVGLVWRLLELILN